MNLLISINARPIDFGGNASLGFNYRLAKAIWFNVNAGYYQGFLDTYTNGTDNELNGNVRLDVGLSFGL